MKLRDLVGQRFGRLLVLERAHNRAGRVAWTCECECGNQTVVLSGNLQPGRTESCGCLHRERATAANKAHKRKAAPGHGAVHDRLAALRGRAKDHTCADCPERAYDWSYVGGDPAELIARRGRCSLDPSYYIPRCRRCHRQHDTASGLQLSKENRP